MKILNVKGKAIAVLANDTHISKWVEQSGRLDHDQNMLPLLAPYIKKGDTVIDCGAFCGDHTQYYIDRVGGEGSVYAFEPNLAAFNCLEFNMDKYLNVHLFNKGLSDKPHSISISQSDNVGASHAIDGNDVECITLDSLNLESCHFIKMDCEGMELKALLGAKETIKKFKPVMLLEINRGALERQRTSAEEIFLWLTTYGYSYRNIYKEQGLNDAQLDIICTPQ
jgi:FkbM family methyltransferase